MSFSLKRNGSLGCCSAKIKDSICDCILRVCHTVPLYFKTARSAQALKHLQSSRQCVFNNASGFSSTIAVQC